MSLLGLQLRQCSSSNSVYDKPLDYLEHHVRIRNLRDNGEVEDDRQKKYKACDCQVYPLNILQ